jgi:hypothetical protein
MIDHAISVLVVLTKDLPIGTNLALLQFLWMLVSGALLPHRGAIFPALKSIGLSDAATRRAWVAFRRGAWQIPVILAWWRAYIQHLPDWKAHRYEGYQPIAADVTAFWRPTLKDCPSKHYHPAADRALPAVIVGIHGEIGDLNGQRIAVPRGFVRVAPQDGSEKRLWQTMLSSAAQQFKEDEVLVVDAGVKIKDVQEVGIKHFVIRLATNFTSRRNFLPEHRQGRRPKYGALVRPLPRQRKNNALPSTIPNETCTWLVDGRNLRAEIWRDLVLPKTLPSQDNETFDVYAIYDPLFAQPWLLATPLKIKAESVRAIYADRWPVEQVPLSAKHMVGAHRQFVHADESIQRLPELALLAGSILSVLSATFPLSPTGFWDRTPKRTPGRFRRLLFGKPFPEDVAFPEQLRKKRSATAHLPKGILACRAIKHSFVPTITS